VAWNEYQAIKTLDEDLQCSNFGKAVGLSQFGGLLDTQSAARKSMQDG
jgi:hypothetical protein